MARLGFLRPVSYLLARLAGFRTLSAEQLSVVPVIFNAPDALAANVLAMDRKGDPPAPDKWQFHRQLRNGIRSSYPHDLGIFNCIARTGETIRDNLVTYVLYRRITIVLFLLLAAVVYQVVMNSRLLLGAIPSSSAGLKTAIAYVIACALIVGLAGVIYAINIVVKHYYDGAVTKTTDNLTVHIQAYNNMLYVDGFKHCLDMIDEEAGIYGMDGDEKIWPERAKCWAKLAHFHHKRMEMLERMTENYIWESTRTLTILDVVSRGLNWLIMLAFAGFFFWLGGQSPAFGVGTFGVLGLLAPALVLAIVGWEWLGREESDIFHKSMLTADKKKLWMRTADFRNEFSNQVWKDKGKIQRDRPFRGNATAAIPPAPAPAPAPAH